MTTFIPGKCQLTMTPRCPFSPRDGPRGYVPWTKLCLPEVTVSCGLVGGSTIQKMTQVPLSKGGAEVKECLSWNAPQGQKE